MHCHMPENMRAHTLSYWEFFWDFMRLSAPTALIVGLIVSGFSYWFYEDLAVMCSTLGFFTVFSTILVTLRIHNTVRHIKDFTQPHYYAFDDDYLFTRSPLGAQQYRWECFNGFKEGKYFLFLLLVPGMYISLPKVIWSTGELEAIRGQLKIKTKAGVLPQQKDQAEKP